MIRLIKNELKKIFHKKSFYVVTIIFALFVVLTNVIYKDNDYVYFSDSVSIEELKEENATLDLNNESDLYRYVNNLANIELQELKNTYKSDNQIYLIEHYLHESVYDYYNHKYIIKDSIDEAEQTKENLIQKVKENDFEYFVEKDIASLKNTTYDDEVSKKVNDYTIKLSEYRLKNHIPFDNQNYLNNAIDRMEESLHEFVSLSTKEKLTKNEEEQLQYVKGEIATNEYVLKEHKDINSGNNLKSVLANFPYEFGLFILIYVIMLSGSIVSEEYNKGTIKFLLTKPYKRSTILTSKLLTLIILIPIILIAMYLIEILIGGIILGFDSLSIPMVLYDGVKGVLVVKNIFAYSIQLLISLLPMYFVLMILCFMLSTITASTSAAITISFMAYLGGNIIAEFLARHSIPILNVFVSIHWDFSYLVTLSEHPFAFKPIVSLGIVLLYIIAMLLVTYLYFKNKDVKNI